MNHTTYAIRRNGHTVATSTDRAEALRIADAYTRADRALHTILPIAHTTNGSN